MKRALVFVAIISLFGFAGLAQFSGEWEATLNILPSVGLDESTLTLNYEAAGWTFGSESVFKAAGWDSQEFSFEGAIGPVSINGSMAFSPTDVAYKSTDIKTSMDFAGMSISTEIYHAVYPYITGDYATIWSNCSGRNTQTKGDVLILYTTEVTVDPFSAKVRLADCCTGTEFYDATISLKGIGLCCGLAYDATLKFDKAGFQSLKFDIANLFNLCCGISFDMSVTFETDKKIVELTPSIDLGGDCLDLGLEVSFDNYTVDGIGINSIGINCEYGDCLTAMFGTAFPREKVIFEGGTTYYFWEENGAWYYSDTEPDHYDASWTPTADIEGVTIDAPASWGLESGIYFEASNGNLTKAIWFDEYEVAKFHFCGAACCGGQYEVDLAAYWADFYDLLQNGTQVYPTLFGLSRFSGSFTVPVMDSFSVNMELTHWLLSGITELSIGWDFTF